MAIETFDDFDSTEDMQQSNLKPFQFRDNPSNKEKTLEWLNQAFDELERAGESRFNTYQRWHALYKGIHWRNFDTRSTDRNVEISDKKPRMVTNFVHDAIDTKVAQMARLNTSFVAIPASDDQDDVNSAKAAEHLMKARAYEMDLDRIHRDADKIKYEFGTVFQFVQWDPDSGPLHPTYKKMSDLNGGNVPKKLMQALGYEGSIHIGDVCVYNKGPDLVLIEKNKRKWEEIDYIFEIDWKTIEEVKALYPKVKDAIMPEKRPFYDWDSMGISHPEDMIMVRTFYHRKTKHLPNGAKIVFVNDAICEWKSLEYNDGKLPCVIDTDIDVYGEVYGRSFITNIEQMQRMHNNIMSGVARDLGVGSAPKWVLPKGAAEFKQLSNDFGIIEFKGPIAPQLVQYNPVNQQAVAIKDAIKSEIYQFSKVYDITRGEVPAGVTANSALRFLDEQESQRLFHDEKKRKRRVLDVYRLMLARMGQYYSADDGRMIRMLGRNNEYLIRSFNNADFTQVIDVQLQNTSALPDTKTGKIASIIDLNTATQTDPVFTKEEIIKILDLGLEDRFKTSATVAVDTAKTFLEMMLNGEQVPEVEEHDELLVHYNIFMKAIQSITFKTKARPEVKQAIFDRITVIEGLMWIRSQKNPKFAQELSAFSSSFPSFFEIPAPPPMPMPMEEVGSQPSAEVPPVQANKMKNTTGEIEQATEMASPPMTEV